ncbi:hypothetical protein CRUP_000099 [Coryphaenoides rupestris]|nr:hypothetical protein CRUP_000099 [Coryphaenoides rupestris]
MESSSVTSSTRPYHVIVFGASGFTGQFVVEEVARCAAAAGITTTTGTGTGSLRWAVAGAEQRSAGEELRTDIEMIVADVSIEESLAAMCQQGLLVLNCVGPGGGGHDATWQSAVYGFADSGSLRKLRRRMGVKPLPVVGPKLKTRGSVFFSKEIDQYSIPFMGSDPSVVQYSAYVGVGGWFSVAKLLCGGLLFWFMVKFSLGRKLLTTMEDTSFCMTFFGEGYSEGKDPSLGRPDTKICTQVIGAEPGYVATPAAMVQAAITVLTELHSLPKRGGVYTPAGAFSNTRLIERLNTRGVKFSVRSYP